MIFTAIQSIREHPCMTALFGVTTGTTGVWLAENAHVIASYSAALLSLGSFIIIAPKVAEQLRLWAGRLRRRLCRALIWGIRRLRR